MHRSLQAGSDHYSRPYLHIMGIRDTLHFDEDAYSAKLNTKTNAFLIKKHHQKTMLLHSNSFVYLGGSIAAVPTAGVTLISSGYAARQWFVVSSQRHLIATLLVERGQPVPKSRLRDKLGGTLLGTVSMFTTLVLPGVVDGAVGSWFRDVTDSVDVRDVFDMPVNMENTR